MVYGFWVEILYTGSNALKTFSTIVRRTFSVIHYGTTAVSNVNFGQKPFKFPPPAGLTNH
jgi:hypothetical protein